MPASDAYQLRFPIGAPSSGNEIMRNQQYLEKEAARWPLGFGLVWAPSPPSGGFTNCPAKLTLAFDVQLPVGKATVQEGAKITDGYLDVGSQGLWEINCAFRCNAQNINTVLAFRFRNLNSGQIVETSRMMNTTVLTNQAVFPGFAWMQCKAGDKIAIEATNYTTGGANLGLQVYWFTAKCLRTF